MEQIFHCLGTFWNDAEITVIRELSQHQELSPEKVLVQALRTYQLVATGHSLLVETDPAMKMSEANSKLDREVLARVIWKAIRDWNDSSGPQKAQDFLADAVIAHLKGQE